MAVSETVPKPIVSRTGDVLGYARVPTGGRDSCFRKKMGEDKGIALRIPQLQREDGLSGDRKTQDAVERNFERIGEALKRVRHRDPDLAERVPDIAGIVDSRNVLAHEYDAVDIVEAWGIIEERLPGLRLAIGSLKTEIGDSSIPSAPGRRTGPG